MTELSLEPECSDVPSTTLQLRSVLHTSVRFSYAGGGLFAKLWPTLGDPMDYSPPGSSVHGVFQARILEWIAISFSRGSSPLRDWTWVFCIAGGFFTSWATRKALSTTLVILKCKRSFESPREHIKLQIGGLQIQSFWVSSRSGMGIRICISNEFSGNADAAGPGIMLEVRSTEKY